MDVSRVDHRVTALFDPVTIATLETRNRLWIAPMCQYSVETEDGVPADWHLAHLGSLAAGRPGLVWTEATAVTADGRISPWDTGIWNDEQTAAWRRITALSHAIGTPIGVQLAHAGRKASTVRPWQGRGSVAVADGGWRTVAPSAVPYPGLAVPGELTDPAEVVRAFAASAVRAVEAGFDAVEVHAAHGYLIHQFLSPISNHRTDEWGGSLEHRARLLIETVEAVRAAIPAGFPIAVRFSGTDWIDGGWTIDDTVAVARWAADAGADTFDVSSGGSGPAEIPLAPGYQVPMAAAVREAIDVPVSAVGLITTAQQADELVASGRVDVVQVARAALRNPHLPLEWADELGVAADWPPQYERGDVDGSGRARRTTIPRR